MMAYSAAQRRNPYGLTKMDTSWFDDAACRGVGVDMFFDSDPHAYDYCFRCPVTTPCADYAWENGLLGIWGGVSERQRANGMRYMPQTRPLKEDQSELAQQIRAFHRQGMSWTQIRLATGVRYSNIARLSRRRAR